MLFLVGIPTAVLAQSFSIPIRTSNSENTFDTVRFGLDPNATDCIDAALGEEYLPPKPAFGAFDVRFVDRHDHPNIDCMDQGLKKDIRQYINPAQIDTYRVDIQANSFYGSGYPVTMTWPDISSYYSNPVFLQDIISGSFVNVNMKEQTSCTITSSIINSLYIITGNTVSSAEDVNQLTPSYVALHQNYPNPFNPVTVIQYRLPTSEYVSLKIHNVFGQHMATLVDEMQNPGNKTVRFHAGNMPSGIYYYSIRAGGLSETKKMMLLK